MEQLVTSLEKRRNIAYVAVFVIFLLVLAVDLLYTVEPLMYYEGKYNMYGVYFLFIYKLIELPILYYILMHRYLCMMQKFESDPVFAKKASKHMKLFLFLIPQGNSQEVLAIF